MRCNRGVIEIFFAKSKELYKKKNRIVLARKRLNNAVWRRKRDLNPRAGYPTYSLSRGAPSPLGYFSMVNLYKAIHLNACGGGEEIRTLGPLRDH